MNGKRHRSTACKRVHDYLRNIIAYWELSGRPDLVRDYEDALELVCIALYGYPPAHVTRRVQVLNVPCPQAGALPKWKRDLLGRPLRRIVHVDVFREFTANGRTNSLMWQELLACGHINIHYPFTATERRARHRRCKECQNQQRSVHAELDQRKRQAAAS